MRNVLLGIILALCVVIGYSIGRETAKNGPQPAPPISVDTTSTQDTSAYVEPQNEPTPAVIVKEIPIPVYYADSTAIDSLLAECARLERRGDSLQFILIREQRHYSDSTYDAWVSGVAPKLDSIRTYNEKLIITKEIPVTRVSNPKFVIGLQAGYGASKEGLSPYVGIGVTYNVMSLFKQ